jgi:lipoic acid synthetase
MPRAGRIPDTESLLRGLKLHTICESGRCPNTFQCFPGGAAFLLLGDSCTRNCTFCAVNHTRPGATDPEEPARMVEAARRLRLDYIFLTSVTRDDLADGGAEHYARTIRLLQQDVPGIKVEVLIPDFQGDPAALKTVVEAFPTVIGHNIETVPRLYAEARPMADYRRSLDVLAYIKALDARMVTKSGIMLGLGETRAEVIEVMRDLFKAGCDLLTLGQYLAPSSANHPVVEFITPDEFAGYIPLGLEMGFRGVASAPLMRSSFKADQFYHRAIEMGNQEDGNS